MLGDRDGNPGPERNLDHVAELYQDICDYAASRNVTPVIETNGVLADTKVMAALLKSKQNQLRCARDIHHPYRYFGEAPETTISNLDGHIKYLHIKDSVMRMTGEIQMLGYGDVPCWIVLKSWTKGFDGLCRWNG